MSPCPGITLNISQLGHPSSLLQFKQVIISFNFYRVLLKKNKGRGLQLFVGGCFSGCVIYSHFVFLTVKPGIFQFHYNYNYVIFFVYSDITGNLWFTKLPPLLSDFYHGTQQSTENSIWSLFKSKVFGKIIIMINRSYFFSF